MYNFFKKNWFKLVLSTYFIFLLFVFIWNILHYSTYWAYDGGGHLEYIESLLLFKKLPNFSDTYLSWHEPLYYLLQAVFVKFLTLFTDNKNIIVEILEISSALFVWFFVLLSTSLSWIISKSKKITILVTLSVGSLFVVSEMGRYVTNEVFFQFLFLLWINIFYFWKMYDSQNWSVFRWIVLTFFLSIILWTKLTAIVLLLALFIWLTFYAWQKKNKKAIILAFFVLFVSIFFYSPWLVYKKVVFGKALTINNYEVETADEVSKRFFLTWDNSIMKDPFWESGKKSFWSMFIASSLVDYDNIFQNYYGLSDKTIQTGSSRFVNYNKWVDSLLYLWTSVPIVLVSIFGLIIFMMDLLKRKLQDKRLLLVIIFFGLFFSLVYNVFRYPFVERGTLKSLFIVSFFPLLFVFSFEALCKIKQKKIPYILFILYMVFWFIFSFFNLFVTGPFVIGIPIY